MYSQTIEHKDMSNDTSSNSGGRRAPYRQVGYSDDSTVKQLGWNCFEVAVGNITRSQIVEYALAHAEDMCIRRLLAPEIKHAVALTVAYQNKLIFDPEFPRGTNLLPAVMCTEEMRALFNQYGDIENTTDLRDAFAQCNDAVGCLDGSRLSWQALEQFFDLEANRNVYPDGYELFSRNHQLITEAANVFNDYCCRRDIYELYVNEYYGKNQWFAFNAEATAERSTGMIDITAKMLTAMIVTHLPDGRLYKTDAYGPRVIHIDYNGVNHFSASISVAVPHFYSVDKKLSDSDVVQRKQKETSTAETHDSISSRLSFFIPENNEAPKGFMPCKRKKGFGIGIKAAQMGVLEPLKTPITEQNPVDFPTEHQCPEATSSAATTSLVSQPLFSSTSAQGAPRKFKVPGSRKVQQKVPTDVASNETNSEISMVGWFQGWFQ
jgi:hypothetical protein